MKCIKHAFSYTAKLEKTEHCFVAGELSLKEVLINKALPFFTEFNQHSIQFHQHSIQFSVLCKTATPF